VLGGGGGGAGESYCDSGLLSNVSIAVGGQHSSNDNTPGDGIVILIPWS
jgi:hypothetical protein